MFDVKDAVVKYKGIIKIPEVNKILPLHITEKGILLVGDIIKMVQSQVLT